MIVKLRVRGAIHTGIVMAIYRDAIKEVIERYLISGWARRWR